MSRESLKAIHSPNGRALNGRAHCHQDPKRRDGLNQGNADRFFYAHEIVHAEFLPQGQTISRHVYKNILRRLMSSVREKRRKLWETRSWLLHDDNAPAHNASGIREFLTKTLPYSSNHPTFQIWPIVTSFCFPNSRKSKELVFEIQKPLNQP